MRRGCARARGRRRERGLRGADRAPRPGRARAPAAARHRRGRDARADRPRARSRSCGATRATRRAAPTATTTTTPSTTTTRGTTPAAPTTTTPPWRSRASTPPTSCARTRARLRDADEAAPGAGSPAGGLVVFAVDTELLGHWWYEGLAWLRAVVEECSRQGLELVRLDDALERDGRSPRTPRRGAGALAAARTGGRAAGEGTATCRPGRARRWPRWPSPRARPSSRSLARGPAGEHAGGARAAGAAGQRLGLHGLPRARRPLRARALRGAPQGARRALGAAGPGERAGPSQPRRATPTARRCSAPLSGSLHSASRRALAHADHARRDARDDRVLRARPW